MMEMTENHENTAFLLSDTRFSFIVVSKIKRNDAVTVILALCARVDHQDKFWSTF